MYLSRLDLHGFKSFAQKTSVDFSPGVTAIVGPNGCGKSNVIDAVRWVLGEQRSRLLRSESMAGVIFNGSAGKKPLGLAEVSLTVENTRGVLPTEYAEVTVTRRLYRNGDSEYLLNGTVCRLRDVLDLFMDTGMGAGAYSVIELSMVEDILSEQADDRRRLFEEAAGVTKYKRRRAQALRRLDATQADLTRLDDIIEEVDKQVRSLSRQAQKAARHERLATRLRRLELALAAHDVDRLQTERDALEREARERDTEAEGFGAQVAAGEAQIEAARTALVGLEQDMATAARALRTHAETVQALEAEIRLGDERRSAGRRALDRIGREREADQTRARDAERDEAEAEGQIETTEATLAERDAALLVADGERAEARDAAEAARRAAQSARATAAEATAALRDAERAVERARDRRALLAAEAERVETERADLAAAPQAHPDHDRLAAAEADLARAAQGLDAATAARDAARTAFEAADADRQRARTAAGAARAQADLLQALVDAGPEGDGAAAFLAAHPDVDAPPLAEVVGAAEADRLALDAALGAFAQALVVSDEDEADAAIGRLRAAEQGRATFLVLSRVGRSQTERSPVPPGTTPALDLARADARFRPLLQALLGNTFVAGSLVDARALRDAYPVARFVTRDGAWLDAGPAVHGGSPTPSAQAGRFGVRERQADAAQALADAERARDAAEERAEAARQARDAAEQDRRRAEGARDAARDARDAARDAATRADAQAAARDAQLARLGVRADQVRQSLADLPDTDDLDDAVAARQLTASDAQARQATAEAEAEAATAARQSAETAWSDARLGHARAQSAAQAARDARDRAAQTRADIARRQADRDAEADRLAAEIAQTEAAAETTTQRLDAERRQTDALQTTASDAETAVLQGRARIADAERGLREIRQRRETATTARAEAERRLAQVATRQETTLERLAEEHGADLDAGRRPSSTGCRPRSCSSPRPPASRSPTCARRSARSAPSTRSRSRATRPSRSGSPFCKSSAATWPAPRPRSWRPSARSTRPRGRASTRRSPRCAQAFQKIFADLFGGDATADVALDGDDPLEAPVTITAQPKGKRPVSLTQLSGGEKTLTATALLFAIYLVKPSPFCILDEVDAPLDDANVGRFMRLIRSFSDSTQFILVTHNKLTMEAADRMYGVTMPTPGVSRLVGVRFDQDEAPAGAEAA